LSIAQTASSESELDASLDVLSRGASVLSHMSLDQRIELLRGCIEGVGAVSRDWVNAACEAKRIPRDSPARTEEVTAGPLATLRFLQLTLQTYQDIRVHGSPRLPAPVEHVSGQCRVPVFPTRQLYDGLLFRPMTAETWLHSSINPDAVSARGTERVLGRDVDPEVVAVLGAGNVSSIPATDALTMIFLERNVVALKMNPVNDYLGPYLQTGFRPLIDAGLLQIAYGGIESGKYFIDDHRTDRVHITGSIQSHNNIVWGTGQQGEQRRLENRPVLEKAITSELGNVSPWAVVPGRYSESELRSQVELIATSIVNNVSFNCIATKIILTSRDWPQRQRFYELLNELLRSIPLRYAYYPGASERFEKFSGRPAENPRRLPWTLLHDIDPAEAPHLLREESFTPVCAELVVDAESDVDFLYRCVDMMNEQIWGTLATNLTVTNDFQVRHAADLDDALRKLRYGTIAINQWAALSFALISPPWGGYPESSLADAQSGIGFVHNTFLLDRPEKTVLRGPLRTKPKPIWDSTHRHPERVAWDLLDLYRSPSMLRLPKLCISSFTG
tara:strand:+ start:596872 stop:598548 length:1677 start_codon:yes stop_codon:yes gene_type:complete